MGNVQFQHRQRKSIFRHKSQLPSNLQQDKFFRDNNQNLKSVFPKTPSKIVKPKYDPPTIKKNLPNHINRYNNTFGFINNQNIQASVKKQYIPQRLTQNDYGLKTGRIDRQQYTGQLSCPPRKYSYDINFNQKSQQKIKQIRKNIGNVNSNQFVLNRKLTPKSTFIIENRNKNTKNISEIQNNKKYNMQDSQKLQKSRNQIIRKIRNFNDFINAVRKQLDESRAKRNCLNVKMELQNKAFDIAKYKYVFEKEFSRDHQIQNIKIQQNDQVKYLSIEYENKELKDKYKKITPESTQRESRILKGKIELKERLKKTVQQLKQISQILYQDNESKVLKINNNIQNITNIIDGKEIKQKTLNPQKIKKMNLHFDKLEIINQIEEENLKRVKKQLQLIQSQPQDSSYIDQS